MNPQIDWSKCMAYLGGSFDPPHVGHQKALQELIGRFPFYQIAVLPNGNQPQKTASASAEHRFKMCQAAFEGISDVEISDFEFSENGKRNYSFDTFQKISAQIHPKELVFIMGSDQLLSFETWNHFPEILESCHWIVLKRASDDPEYEAKIDRKIRDFQNMGILHSAPQQSSSDHFFRSKNEKTWLLLIQTQAPEVSSTEIRRELTLDPQYINQTADIPTNIKEYIQAHHLYGN